MQRNFILLPPLLIISLFGFAQQDELHGNSVNDSPIQEIIKQLESKLQKEVSKDSIGSISGAVVINENIIWTKGFGLVDNIRYDTASCRTIYMIGSISKSVTAILFARLVDKNILNWDDPVKNYVPEIRYLSNSRESAQRITLRHLASHTAGIAREPNLLNANKGSFEDWEKKLIMAIPTTEMLFESGETYHYSNIGYAILGLALSRAAGKPFDVLLKEEVFVPLGMRDSDLILSLKNRQNLAKSFNGTRDYELGRGYKFPNGGVYSTSRDMANLIKAILDTDFKDFLSDVSKEELFQIQTIHFDHADEASGYGLGFTIWTDKKEHKLALHNGIIAPGYSASMFCDLKTKVGIVMLRNGFYGKPDIMELADAFIWKLSRVIKE